MTITELAFLRISGDDRISFMQGIVSQDVTKLAVEKIQFAALLSPQGKILHDMFLIDMGDAILIDAQAAYVETLLKRLLMYKLRAKVTITPITLEAGSWKLEPLPDPRHPALPHYTPLTNRHAPLALGIPELGRDFDPDSVVLLDAGYDLLHAVSFTKGCYVGQEVTARMHYKSTARRGFYILSRDGIDERLALLRFDEVGSMTGEVTVDNIRYHARLPEWMIPKFVQFQSQSTNQ